MSSRQSIKPFLQDTKILEQGQKWHLLENIAETTKHVGRVHYHHGRLYKSFNKGVNKLYLITSCREKFVANEFFKRRYKLAEVDRCLNAIMIMESRRNRLQQ